MLDRIVGTKRAADGNGHLTVDANLITEPAQLTSRVSAWEALRTSANSEPYSSRKPSPTPSQTNRRVSAIETPNAVLSSSVSPWSIIHLGFRTPSAIGPTSASVRWIACA